MEKPTSKSATSAQRAAWEKALALPEIESLVATAVEARIIDSYTQEKNTQKADEVRDQFSEVHLQRLKRLTDAKQWSSARGELVALMALSKPGPLQLGFHLGLSDLHVQERDWGQAQSELEQVLTAMPAAEASAAEVESLRGLQQAAQQRLGVVYALQGQVAKARAQFEKVLALPQLDAALKASTEKELAKLPAAAG